jgi:hypothetical protein
MSLGTMVVGATMAVAALLAVSGQSDLAAIQADGTQPWAQAGDRSILDGPHGDTFLDVAYSDSRGLLFNFGMTDIGPAVFAAPDMPDAPGVSHGNDGALTITAAPELTTWATLALTMAPLGAAARFRRRWIAHAVAV